MCFGNDVKTPAPTPPPETLDQAAPVKKSVNKKDAGALAIGTKRYRTEAGLGHTATKSKLTPTGPSVNL